MAILKGLISHNMRGPLGGLRFTGSPSSTDNVVARSSPVNVLTNSKLLLQRAFALSVRDAKCLTPKQIFEWNSLPPSRRGYHLFVNKRTLIHYFHLLDLLPYLPGVNAPPPNKLRKISAVKVEPNLGGNPVTRVSVTTNESGLSRVIFQMSKPQSRFRNTYRDEWDPQSYLQNDIAGFTYRVFDTPKPATRYNFRVCLFLRSFTETWVSGWTFCYGVTS